MKDGLKVINLYAKADSSILNKFDRNLQSSYSVDDSFESLEVNFEWLEIMEDTVRYLDNIMRSPNRFIVNEEEVVKIEQARRITVESIKHLAKHTNFIQEINENDEVKPSKILNINKDESYDTYENRLIYTLIQNMRTFVDIRKMHLITDSYTKDNQETKYTGVTKIGNESISISVDMESKIGVSNKCGDKDDMTVEQRIEKLDMRINDLMNSQVYKTLAKAHVARVIPPIKKTNLILKNVNFQYAMRLWDFLARYDDKSNAVKKNKSSNVGDINIKELFDDVFLLNYLIAHGLKQNNGDAPESNKDAIEKLTSDMLTTIVELNANMPLDELEKIIGDKIAIIRNKKEASISEIQHKLNEKMQAILDRIGEFKF